MLGPDALYPYPPSGTVLHIAAYYAWPQAVTALLQRRFSPRKVHQFSPTLAALHYVSCATPLPPSIAVVSHLPPQSPAVREEHWRECFKLLLDAVLRGGDGSASDDAVCITLSRPPVLALLALHRSVGEATAGETLALLDFTVQAIRAARPLLLPRLLEADVAHTLLAALGAHLPPPSATTVAAILTLLAHSGVGTPTIRALVAPPPSALPRRRAPEGGAGGAVTSRGGRGGGLRANFTLTKSSCAVPGCRAIPSASRAGGGAAAVEAVLCGACIVAAGLEVLAGGEAPPVAWMCAAHSPPPHVEMMRCPLHLRTPAPLVKWAGGCEALPETPAGGESGLVEWTPDMGGGDAAVAAFVRWLSGAAWDVAGPRTPHPRGVGLSLTLHIAPPPVAWGGGTGGLGVVLAAGAYDDSVVGLAYSVGPDVPPGVPSLAAELLAAFAPITAAAAAAAVAGGAGGSCAVCQERLEGTGQLERLRCCALGGAHAGCLEAAALGECPRCGAALVSREAPEGMGEEG